MAVALKGAVAKAGKEPGRKHQTPITKHQANENPRKNRKRRSKPEI